MTIAISSAHELNSLDGLNGVYISKNLPAASTAARNLTLILSEDGTAAMTTEFVGKGTLIERGAWRAKGKRAEITWTELDGADINLRMIFELRENELVFIGPDPNAFGALEIRLYRVSAMK